MDLWRIGHSIPLMPVYQGWRPWIGAYGVLSLEEWRGQHIPKTETPPVAPPDIDRKGYALWCFAPE